MHTQVIAIFIKSEKRRNYKNLKKFLQNFVHMYLASSQRNFFQILNGTAFVSTLNLVPFSWDIMELRKWENHNFINIPTLFAHALFSWAAVCLDYLFKSHLAVKKVQSYAKWLVWKNLWNTGGSKEVVVCAGMSMTKI